MGEWAFLGSLLDSVQLQSPLVGRLWLVVMLIFRILVLATVGGAVFEDEQEEFVCNTLQPGCRQACYDRAFPISHYRFWLFHILLLSAPPVLFIIYSMHQASKGPSPQGDGMKEQEEWSGSRGQHLAGPRARHCYLLSVALRLLAELGFLVGQTLLYGFQVAARFSCTQTPCPHIVDCFVSRPTEKTVFVIFYFAVGLLSTLLSVAELFHLFWKGRRSQNRGPLWLGKVVTGEKDNHCNQEQEEAQKLLLPLSPPRRAPPLSPTQDAPPAYAHKLQQGGSEGSTSRSKSSLSTAREDLSI
ncbi:gap junction delta-3 protein [Gracilinanus agilis]|uniref:gap junction delta-3 protein n=1 Tax=Gracilinanus agilis TaxID=191870 RepID=UPI001CFD72A1|nr:gap junction delta-3 protein [Gracilinanus agilis]